jgi:type I restriction enzyme S subunit
MNASSVRWVRLGDYIERSMVNNSDLKYGPELIEGVNSDGVFCESRANTIDINLKPYKIVNNGDFVYNPSRLNLGSLAYRTTGMCIVSHLYVVFRLNELGKRYFLPDFLYMYFKRNEFLRLVTFLNLGSQRPEFNFYDMSEIRVPMPTLDIQHEVVATYNGLKSLAEQNEALIKPISNACEAFIVNCKSLYPEVEIGEYILACDERNNFGKYQLDNLRGISTDKQFIETKANMDGVSLSSYKVVKPNEFAYVADTSRRGDKIALALNSGESAILISSIYTSFRCNDINKLLPEYLYLLLSRSEFDRYARFNSWGSARETFDWEELCRVKIALPPIEVQQSVVNLYYCLEEARKIATEAREQLKTLCPALVQKAANS